MITIKTADELDLMRQACALTAQCMQEIRGHVRPGVTTKALDEVAYSFITGADAKPSFKGYRGYPASICASVNEVVVHGIPGNRELVEGDIIGIDLGVYYKGFHGDMTRTFAIGTISDEAQKLIDTAKDCFEAQLQALVPGCRVGDLGYAAQAVAESRGYSVVRELCGHGIGRNLHEDPEVPNYGSPGKGMRLRPGMTVALEPMVNAGDYRIMVLDDGWTVATYDGRLSAHYENTVLVTEEGSEILTHL